MSDRQKRSQSFHRNSSAPLLAKDTCAWVGSALPHMLAPSPSQARHRLQAAPSHGSGAHKVKPDELLALNAHVGGSQGRPGSAGAAVPFVPQHVKNRNMNKRLQEVEAELAEELRVAEQQADYNVSRYTAFIASKYALDGLDEELKDSKDTAAEELERSLAVKNDLVTRLKLEFDLKERNFKAYYPEWMNYLVQIAEVVKEL